MTTVHPAPTVLPTTAAVRPDRLLPAVAVDLYRDIHKGIRSELFAVTTQAGSSDPSSAAGREALAARVDALVELLVMHAEHEDVAVQPALTLHVPEGAAQIAREHPALESRLDVLRDMAGLAVRAARADQRPRTHQLYLELASFTSAYLAHQDLEERVVMPALDGAIGPEAVLAIHLGIIRSIPPEVMASSLALMLPAMHVEERAELLRGIRADAPAAVFEGVWGLAGAVLAPDDQRALAGRLGLDASPTGDARRG